MNTYLYIKDRLKAAGVDNYAFEAKIISEYAGGDVNMIKDIIRRRAKKEPLQYILGGWEFYGDEYILTADCLIPRPETEFLTEYIISSAPKSAFVLDLCCGSGCIAISALKRREDLRAAAIEISTGAVETAKKNAEIHAVLDRIEFYCMDILDMSEDGEKILNICKDTDLIVSNPPYLTLAETEQIKRDKSELSYEPEAAFFGGRDGLDFYRFIIKNYSLRCKPHAVTAFEVGKDQYKAVTAMFEEINFSCDIIKDYQKIERIVVAQRRL